MLSNNRWTRASAHLLPRLLSVLFVLLGFALNFHMALPTSERWG